MPSSNNFGKQVTMKNLLSKLRKIKGGYVYSGVCSYQVCFPLKMGGELRFMISDEKEGIYIDYYDGALPPGITGPTSKTGV